MKSWDLIGFSWFGIMEVPSDNSDTGSSPADGSYARVNSLNDFTYDVYTSELNGWWTGNYKGIGFCNVALDNLDVLKDEQLKIRSIAQARFFRGFFYFNLVRTYGGVPLVTKVQNPDEYDQPCASEEAIYQQIIDDYNSEQDRATIEKTFMNLMDLANQMNQEEQRYVREGFSSDEELSFYDMLFRDDLSKNDIKKLKEVAADLLHKIKEKISELDHWTDKQETKAAVDNLIRDTLWAELPECYDEVSISGYRQKIYEYVYTRYKEVA